MKGVEKGGRVLVEATCEELEMRNGVEIAVVSPGYNLADKCKPLRRHVHAHPGVPVADLVEEIELIQKWRYDAPGYMGEDARAGLNRIRELRAAREVAQRPKLRYGEEVWVRTRVVSNQTGSPVVVTSASDYGVGMQIEVDPRDVRRRKP